MLLCLDLKQADSLQVPIAVRLDIIGRDIGGLLRSSNDHTNASAKLSSLEGSKFCILFLFSCRGYLNALKFHMKN